MKKRFAGWICVVMAVFLSCCFVLSGCDLFNCEADLTGHTFTVTYNDYDGAHSFDVRHGFEYSITPPTRTGYEFLGLYDAETDGRQFVAANGNSIGKYEERDGILLYPRWKAKDYTVNLNYGEATGSVNQLTATYGESLPALPQNVTLNHKVFKGWYTAAHCGGVQVADTNGLLPAVSVLNEQNFNISDGNNRINLYAGFENEKYRVTLNFNGIAQNEVITVEYETPVSGLIYDTRNSGRAVYKWSTKSDMSDEFDGVIDKDITLYAKLWAEAISFDTDGGNKLAPVVASTGANITLPKPEKDLYKFLHWENNGQKYTATTMPSTSVTLKAVWQAKIVLDENGGGNVDDISKAAGETVTLPTPEREGYFFAGWYDVYEEKYTATEMPSKPVKLKAGWHKAVKVTKNLSTSRESAVIDFEPSFSMIYAEINPSALLSVNGATNLRIKWHFKARHSDKSDSMYIKLNFYNQKTASNAYLITKKQVDNITSSWRTCEVETEFTVSDTFYVVFTTQYADGNWSVTSYYISDLYADFEWADTSTLYL